MKFLNIIKFFFGFIPEFIQKFFLNIFYFLFSKYKYRNKISIYSKKSVSKKYNLVIAKNMHSLGDFFVSLNVIKNINEQKTDYRYVFVVDEFYKEFILKENFNEENFIFLKSDFSDSSKGKKNSKNEIIFLSNDISNQIKKYCKNWENVFICSAWLDITHFSILSKINYNFAYYLKHFATESKPRILWQNLPVSSFSLWLYFFHFYKKFNLKIWNLNDKETYYFGKMSYDMIKQYDAKLQNYAIKENNVENKTKLLNVSIMLKSYIKSKNINIEKFEKFLLSLNKNLNFYFLGRDYYDIPTINNLNLINLTGKTKNFLDLINQIKKSQLVITADTSLYHIASYFGIPTIVFVNSKIPKIDRSIKFWLENYKGNLIIKNHFFFNNSKKLKFEKEFDVILSCINFFIKNKFEND